jgi:hypothetical protein
LPTTAKLAFAVPCVLPKHAFTAGVILRIAAMT